MNELAKSIAELINSLNGSAKSAADALARVAPEAWRQLVWRVRFEAIVQMLAIAIVAAALAFVARKLFAHAKTIRFENESDRHATYRDEEAVAFALVWAYVFTTFAVAAAVGALAPLSDIVTPETTAARILLREVRRGLTLEEVTP